MMQLIVELFTKNGREPFNSDTFVADVVDIDDALDEVEGDISNYNARKVHKAVYYLMDDDGAMTGFNVSFISNMYRLIPDISAANLNAVYYSAPMYDLVFHWDSEFYTISVFVDDHPEAATDEHYFSDEVVQDILDLEL